MSPSNVPENGEPSDPLVHHHPITRGLYHVVQGIAVLVLAAYVIILITQVMLRYGFNSSLVWSEEIVRFGLVWNVMLGSALVSLKNSHIRVDILENILPPPYRQILQVFISIVCVIFSSILFYYAVIYIVRSIGQRSALTNAPMWLAYASIAVGAFLIVVFSLAVLVQQIAAFKRRRNP